MSTENSRVLIVVLLTIQSSYINNTQEPAGDVPDAVQLWVEPEGASRIRTFASDQDIHIYRYSHPAGAGEAVIDAFLQSVEQNYGDLIASTHRVHFEDYTNEHDVIAQLDTAELNGGLQITEIGIAYYNPDHKHSRLLANEILTNNDDEIVSIAELYADGKPGRSLIDSICVRPKMYTTNGTLGEAAAFIEGYQSGSANSNKSALRISGQWGQFFSWASIRMGASKPCGCRELFELVGQKYPDEEIAFAKIAGLCLEFDRFRGPFFK